METLLQTRILAGLAYAQVEAHESSKRYGYWEKDRSITEAVALIHRDAAHLLELLTVGDGPSSKLHDVTRLEEKMADIIIRVLDIGGGKNLRIPSALVAKLEYNERMSKLTKRDF